tara:strand:- start:11837 stop:12025 length:189 start_codon:yes stop_codon:yes gene_type:complete
MKQLDLFRIVEPESDLEKLDTMVSSDHQDQLDIIEWDISSAIESGDHERLSQLIEMKKSYMN